MFFKGVNLLLSLYLTPNLKKNSKNRIAYLRDNPTHILQNGKTNMDIVKRIVFETIILEGKTFFHKKFVMQI